LELAPAVLDRLDMLVDETNSSSRSETLRRALGFYWLLVNEAKAGNAIEIISGDGKRKSLLVLEAT
jgi:metal-responsive CopG/Arc/MetJ family transcriptional regulator